MKIRQYLPADHDAVWKLHNIALLAIDAHAGNGAWDDDLHRIEDEYIRTGGEFYIGTVDSRIVAMGALLRLTDDLAEIRRMRVHPDFQRRGFGKLMLLKLEQRAAALGFRRLILDTTAKQTAAIQLYTLFGYNRKDRGKKGEFEILRFEKKIG